MSRRPPDRNADQVLWVRVCDCVYCDATTASTWPSGWIQVLVRTPARSSPTQELDFCSVMCMLGWTIDAHLDAMQAKGLPWPVEGSD